VNLGIAALDGLAACFFFAATVVAALIDMLADRPMRPWAFVMVAFGLLAVERGANALEWSGESGLPLLDVAQGYLRVLASIGLAGLALQFGAVVKRGSRTRQ